MNSKVSLPPISDILSNSRPDCVSLEEADRVYTQPQVTYCSSQQPGIYQQVPLPSQPSNMAIQNTQMLAGTMIATSGMAMSHPQAPMYPMVPVPGYRLINPVYVGDASHIANAPYASRYPVTVKPQHGQLVLPHSAPAVVGSTLRALVVSDLSKASTPASPTSLDTFSRVNRMTPERLLEMVRRPTPPPPARSRTRNNLPKETTYILLKWLEEHLNHPYPNSFEKTQLMFSTGLNQQQLSNWFINARRRKIRAMKQRQRV